MGTLLYWEIKGINTKKKFVLIIKKLSYEVGLVLNFLISETGVLPGVLLVKMSKTVILVTTTNVKK